jgi:hypothetical protein
MSEPGLIEAADPDEAFAALADAPASTSSVRCGTNRARR